MINKIRHLFWKLVLFNTYIKSKDKTKNLLFTNTLNMIRLQYFAKAKAQEWTYESDKLWGLVNRVASPAFSVELTAGDCDDYASAILGQYEDTDNAYLLTYFCKPLIKSHTVPVFKHMGKIVTFNWGKVYTVSSVKELIKLYEKMYQVKIKDYHFAKWNDDKHRYVLKKFRG